jgi:hypothetical protein
MYTCQDLDTLLTCVSFASVMVDVMEITKLGRLVQKINELKRHEEMMFDPDECLALKSCISLAIQSVKVVPNRSFSSQAIAQLGEILEKLSITEKDDDA